MNKSYKTIYNQRTQSWVAVAEDVCSHGKTPCSGSASAVSVLVRTPIALSKVMLSILMAMGGSYTHIAWAEDAYCVNPVNDSTSLSQTDTSGVSNNNAVICGQGASVSSNSAVAIGWQAQGLGIQSIAVGGGAVAGRADDSTTASINEVLGNSIAIGTSAQALTSDGIALGSNAVAGVPNQTSTPVDDAIASSNAIAIGKDSRATSQNSIATGVSTSAGGIGSVAGGWQSATTADYV